MMNFADTYIDADLAAFESHLQQLESNELSTFSAMHLLRQIHWKGDGTYSFLDDNHLEQRMVKAVTTSSSYLHTLCWVLAWLPNDAAGGQECAPRETANDCLRAFLATTITLFDLTLVSPHIELRSTMALSLQSLQLNHSMRRLELQSAHLPLPELCTVISHSKTLRVLSLQGKADLDDAETFDFQSFANLELFSNALAVNMSLRELHLQWINFTYDESDKSATGNTSSILPLRLSKSKQPLNNHNSHNTWLHSLNIRSCHFDTPLAVQILLTPLEAVATLNLNGNRGFDSYIYQLYQSPSLRHLRVINFYFPKQAWLENFLEHHKGDGNNLQSLSIHSNRYHDMEDPVFMWRSVAKFLRDNHHNKSASTTTTTLTSLDLRPDRFEESPPNDILSSITCRKLSFLAVQCPTTLPVSLLGSLSSPHCTLKRLKLSASYNALENHLKYLVAAVGTNQSLEELEIVALDDANNDSVLSTTNNDYWEEHLPRFSMRRLALTNCHSSPGFYDGLFQTLPYCPSLTQLEVGWIASFTNQTVDILCQYLRLPSCTLQTLWLRGHTSTSGNHYLVSQIMPALTVNHSLRSLAVACTLSDLKTIVTPHLSQLSTLQHLELANIESFEFPEHTTSDTMMRSLQTAIVHALCQNKSLVTVEVASFFDPNEYWFPRQVRFYGMRNKIRQTVTTSPDQDIPPGLWPYLLENVQQREHCPSILFHVLTTHMVRDRLRREEPKVKDVAEGEDGRQRPSKCGCGCLRSILALLHRS